jgi:serine/threonine-protein kinase
MRLGRDQLSSVSRFLHRRPLLGELALMRGLLDERDLAEALAAQRGAPTPPLLGTLLVSRGLLTGEQLSDLLAQQKLMEEQEGAGAAFDLPDGTKRLVGPYAVVEQLGAGGAGVVWKAWDTRLRRWVALKERRAGEGPARERFLREAQAAARLRHPNLIEVFEVFQHEGTDYIVLDYVDGRPLDRLRMDAREAAALAAAVGDALEHMHAAGVLHRDVKPQNVLVDAAGAPHLGDFGLAKLTGNEPLTTEGTVVGTPAYMAPEQAARRPDAVGPRTDVYGLGATLYHLLAGRPPFDAGTSLETLFQKLTTEGPPPLRELDPAVPEALDRIVRRAMARRPEDRYATAAEFAEDLRRFARGDDVRARPPSSRRRLRAGLLFAAAALGAAALLLLPESGHRAYEDARQRGDRLWMAAAAGSKEKVPDALRAYETAARALPREPYPWLLIGRCQALLGRAAEAEAAWGEALRRDPAYGPALLERAKQRLGAYAEIRLPRRTSSGGGVRFGRAESPDEARREARRKGEEDLAAARGAKGLEGPALRCLEGLIALGEGRFGDAAAALAAYAREYPWDVDALSFLGAARYYAGSFEEAERAWRRAAELRPEARRFRWLGDAAFARGRPEDAAEAYGRAIELDPGDPSALCSRGQARAALGRAAEARADFDRALALHPSFARARLARGVLRYEQLDLDGALEDLQQAALLDELSPDAHHNLGNVWVRKNRLDDALQEYDVAIGLDPGFAEAHLNRGLARMMKGDAGAALADFAEAARLAPEDPEALYQLARAHEARRDVPKAAEALRGALKAAPADWPRRARAQQLLADWTK